MPSVSVPVAVVGAEAAAGVGAAAAGTAAVGAGAAAAGTAAIGATAAGAGVLGTGISATTLLAGTSLVTGVLGAFTGAAGSAQQAAAMRAQATYQAQVAANNQIIAGQNAMAERAAGAADAAIAGQRTRAAVGEAKAAQAASGIDVNTGSALDVRSSISEIGELNALTIRSNSARRAYGYDTTGAAYGAESGAQRAGAENASAAGDIGVASSLLGGASSTADKALRLQSAGTVGGFF